MSTNFTPSQPELAIVSQIFTRVDPKQPDFITGDLAVTIFSGAKLPPIVLGEIWTIADEDNKGLLSRRGVAIAVRLIGWAQNGEKITPALVNKREFQSLSSWTNVLNVLLTVGPLATIEGISVVTQNNTGLSLPKFPPSSLPPLTAQDKLKFQRIFTHNAPINGLLSGMYPHLFPLFSLITFIKQAKRPETSLSNLSYPSTSFRVYGAFFFSTPNIV
jgi:epidermal growth factor receptor substrate 15